MIPNDHYENVFDLPVELGTCLQEAVRDTALAMKNAVGCSGVSTRQHNEPDGNQDVWHYHIHVFPRFPQDGLYGSKGALVGADDVRRAAQLLRTSWPKDSAYRRQRATSTDLRGSCARQDDPGSGNMRAWSSPLLQVGSHRCTR